MPPPWSLHWSPGRFSLVLGCICETGLMLFTEYVIQNSVQEAARTIRTGQVTAGDGTLLVTAEAFKVKICEQTSIIIDCDGSVDVYVNSADDFADLTAAMRRSIVSWRAVQRRPLHCSIQSRRPIGGRHRHCHL